MMTAEQLQPFDLVQLMSGQRLIVTKLNPNRPANCYTGVVENGKGKEYIFGAKHRPMKIGTVTQDHPALQAMLGRKQVAGFASLPPHCKQALVKLLDLTDEGDIHKIRAAADEVRRCMS